MSGKPDDYALIIGVSDYRDYDRSIDKPAGTSDVPGARNDARTWFRQCIAMGFAPDRIRVLTAPVLAASELGPEAVAANIGLASHDSIVAGLKWLAEMTGGEAASAGLMTFSGHGMGHDDRSLALELCPCDTVSSPGSEHAGLDNVIDVQALREALGDGPVARRLTLVLDCCHAQVGVDREASIRARLHARKQGVELPRDSGVIERVLSACAWDQTSESSRFGGRPMGAFTWALTSAMSQWDAAEEDGVLLLTASNGELIQRARALLDALSFDQQPVLSGPPGAARLAFLHPASSADDDAGETSPEPDARRSVKQLDSGDCGGDSYTLYTLEYWTSLEDYRADRPATTLASVLANGDTKNELNGMSIEPYTEYWAVEASAAASLSSAQVMRFRSSGCTSWSTTPDMPQSALYSYASESQTHVPHTSEQFYPDGSWVTFAGSYLDGGSLAIAFYISNENITKTQWYQPSDALVSVPQSWPVILQVQEGGAPYPIPLSGTFYTVGPVTQTPIS